MFNIFIQDFPTEWNGYEINTGFHIGVQIALLMEDDLVPDNLKMAILIELLFGNEDGTTRDFPQGPEELAECWKWFINGWSYDNEVEGDNQNLRLMDYNVDQGRIYADFLQIYGIDLETTEMHWWRFQWLLWNMPPRQSSFLQVIDIRKREPSKNASLEEKKIIERGKAVYGLQQKKKKLTSEEEKKIDEVDALREEMKKNKQKVEV